LFKIIKKEVTESLNKFKIDKKIKKMRHQVRFGFDLLRVSAGYSFYSLSVHLKQSPQAQPRLGTLHLIKSAFLDCFSESTGHGLPQMAKPDSIFLRVLWVVFFLIALVGGICFISQTVDQYLQFGVITMTKINRESEITMPAITLCNSRFLNTHDMMLSCGYGIGSGPIKYCYSHNLILYDRHGQVNQCVVINHGTNKTELIKAEGEGWQYGYSLFLYTPPDCSIYFAVTDNSARVVYEEVREAVFPGKSTTIILSKTVQSALGPPHSQCNETQEFRQVTCRWDCFNKVMSEKCGCAFPAECGHWYYQTEECMDVYYSDNNRNAILSNCNKECPDECNLVSFPINRVDAEGNTRYYLNKYKRQISAKFNITGISDVETGKRITFMEVYFSRLETTKITQSPSMTPSNLVANVGGLLGK